MCCESDPDLTTVLAIAPSIRAFILTLLLTNFLIWAVTMISYNTNLDDASCFFCILLEQNVSHIFGINSLISPRHPRLRSLRKSSINIKLLNVCCNHV
uniref:G-protein coupled receptors family 1 profile domain-containing protein n=1 Tax=Glossina palpalis gambiensis TaxID=67801 RepID=A0A1B0AT04_9MUSC